MRLFSIAAIALLTLSFASNLRADYALWVVTPENIGEVGNLTVKASAEPSGTVRFVVAGGFRASDADSADSTRHDDHPSTV